MTTWRRWVLRGGALEFYIFRPTWRTVTIGVGWSFEPDNTEAMLMFALGPIHGGIWWLRVGENS